MSSPIVLIGFDSVRHIYFYSRVKVALSAYPQSRQPLSCPWNVCWNFCPQVPPCAADWNLLGGAFVVLFSAPRPCPLHLHRRNFHALLWASRSNPLHHGAFVLFSWHPGPALCTEGLYALLTVPQAHHLYPVACTLASFSKYLRATLCAVELL